MNSRKDYYRILEISPQADKDEIRKAFRLLVKRYHPDISEEPDAAERIKDINEAYEVLSDSVKRAAYDDQRDAKPNLHTEENKDKPRQPPQKNTYQRNYFIRHERKVFVRGRIAVKFWAETPDIEHLASNGTDYLLHPVSAIVYLDEKDIFSDVTDAAYNHAAAQAEILRTPLTQPVTCCVQGKDGEKWYQLVLHDIRLSGILLKHIVKQDQQSLGTLEGTLYAFAISETLEEIKETVTECSGDTGNVRMKKEDGWQWIQREFYNADCSVSWTEWMPQFPLGTATTNYATGNQKYKYNFTPAPKQDGCAPWGILLAILFFGLIPQSILPVVGIIVFIFLLSLGARLLRNAATAIAVVGLIVLGGAFLRAFVVTSKSGGLRAEKRAGIDTASITSDRIEEASQRKGHPDTILRHRIQWKSYDSTAFDLYVGIRASSVRKATMLRNELDSKAFSSLPEVYSWMNDNSKPDMDYTLKAFDSVRKARGLTDAQFADMIVSCIQSVPYFLIVQNECNLSDQRDDFIRQYLRECQTECCMGGVQYGVRSPVEFLEDLRGDCDTRALLAYNILSAFGYDVAIITSDYYKHAAIAVRLDNPPDAGSDVIQINGQSFYPWELTQRGYRAGYLPPDCGDLSLWDIGLMNTKKTSL
ncbi:DnaJ domain-containing protein [Nostoc ellipsosporum NOK]|nr:DnaJ domain-containing protein [Nostoc ellipsosporum NOK]